MNNNIPTYIPLTDFATTNNISKEELTQQVIAGKLKAVQLPNGELLVQKNIPKTKEQIIDNKFSHLKGKLITVTEVSEKYGKKYGFHRNTILKWVKKGYITPLKQNGRGSRMLLDEAESAYCSYIYGQYKNKSNKDTISGGRIFDNEGNPYQLIHPKLAKKRQEN